MGSFHHRAVVRKVCLRHGTLEPEVDRTAAAGRVPAAWDPVLLDWLRGPPRDRQLGFYRSEAEEEMANRPEQVAEARVDFESQLSPPNTGPRGDQQKSGKKPVELVYKHSPHMHPAP